MKSYFFFTATALLSLTSCAVQESIEPTGSTSERIVDHEIGDVGPLTISTGDTRQPIEPGDLIVVEYEEVDGEFTISRRFSTDRREDLGVEVANHGFVPDLAVVERMLELNADEPLSFPNAEDRLIAVYEFDEGFDPTDLGLRVPAEIVNATRDVTSDEKPREDADNEELTLVPTTVRVKGEPGSLTMIEPEQGASKIYLFSFSE